MWPKTHTHTHALVLTCVRACTHTHKTFSMSPLFAQMPASLLINIHFQSFNKLQNQISTTPTAGWAIVMTESDKTQFSLFLQSLGIETSRHNFLNDWYNHICIEERFLSNCHCKRPTHQNGTSDIH